MNLCKDCKYYNEGATVNDDICLHEKSIKVPLGYIRGNDADTERYLCRSMRVGICGIEGKLYEPASGYTNAQQVQA